MGSLDIKLFGEFRLKNNDETVTRLNSPRQQELCTYLLLNRNTPQSRPYLAYQFWPESSEKQARTNLRNLLFKLRKVLPDHDQYLLSDNKTLQWNISAECFLDIAEFQKAIRQAGNAESEGDIARQISALKQAADLYKDDLLVTCYKKWIVPERERLKREYIGVLHILLQQLEKDRCYRQAIPYARKLIDYDEYDEFAYRKLMKLYMLTGSRSLALQTYQECEDILWNELQIEPARKTKKIYEELQSVEILDNESSPGSDNNDSDLIHRNWKEVLSGSSGITIDLPALRSKIGMASLAAGIILLVLVGYGLSSLLNSPPAPPDNTLAVLPLVSLSQNPEELQFADGVHEEMINRLAGIGDLTVIARRSVLRYSPGERDLKAIGQELRVSSLLDGTVRRAGDRIRVTVQLIDVNSLGNIWSGSFEENIDDVFEIQSQIARQVSGELQASLTEEEQERLKERPTDNPKAYRFYMRAREYLSRSSFDGESLRRAEAFFRRSVEEDPQFAHAWAMLAVTYSRLYRLHGKTPKQLENLKKTVERAQVLNSDLPETQLAMGMYLYWSETDHERTLSHFETALQRFPNQSMLHFMTALTHRRLANWKLLFQHLKQALKLDPLNVSIYTELAWDYFTMRDYEKAVAYLDRMTELGFDETTFWPFALVIRSINAGTLEVVENLWDQIYPSDPAIEMPFFWGWYNRWKRDWDEALRGFNNIKGKTVWSNSTQYGLRDYWIAVTLDRRGSRNEALDYFRRAQKHLEELRDQHPEEARYRTALGKVCARLGEYEKAIREGEKATELVPASQDTATGHLYELGLAEIYAWSNRKEQAIDKLEYMLSVPGHAHRTRLRMDPKWDPLRDHSRFQDLIADTDKPFMEDL